jgi:hypothetical protein
MFDFSLKNLRKGPPAEKGFQWNILKTASFITDKLRYYIKMSTKQQQSMVK